MYMHAKVRQAIAERSRLMRVQLVALMYVGVGQLTVTAHGEESGEERVHDFTVREDHSGWC
jgi:hypothetical protein